MKKYIYQFFKKYIFKNRGVSRLVFCFPKYGFVIKIPNFTYSIQHFLLGLLCNYNERKITKDFKNCHDEICVTLYNKIAPSYYCAMFEILLIQKYVKQISIEDFENIDREYFSQVTNDFTYRNFGFITENQIVCLDYGNQLTTILITNK